MNQRSFFLFVCTWTLILQVCTLRLNTFSESNGYEKLEYPSMVNEKSKSQTFHRVPFPSTLENTFILRIKDFEKSSSSNPIRKAKINWVHSIMNTFKKDADKCKIKFFFNYVYYFGFQGFSISLKYPKSIKMIEERREFHYIKEILNDQLLYQNELAVSFVPKLKMGLPIGAARKYSNGKGIKVGVIDGGILFKSSAFIIPGETCVQLKDKGCRVKGVYDFVTEEDDLKNYTDYPPHEPGYDEKNEPYTIHGTAMAALIGGTDDKAPGVAQEVEFFDYRVIEMAGTSKHSRILAALSLALYHGVDVICMSLGGPDGRNPQLSNALRDADDTKDVIVLASMGNLGSPGKLFYTNHPANSASVITVTSFSNPFTKGYRIEIDWILEVTNATMTTHVLGYPVVQVQIFEKLLEISTGIGGLFLNDAKTVEEVKKSTIYSLFNDFIGFIQCDSHDQCFNVLNVFFEVEKLRAFVFISKAGLYWNTFIHSVKPIAQVPKYEFDFHQLLDKSSITIRLHPDYVLHENTPSLPSSISSLGPNDDLELKPDVAAIGCPVLAYIGKTLNVKPGTYDHPYTFSGGTSNANALAVGIVGLLLSHTKAMGQSLSFEDVITRLRNTALPIPYMHPTLLLKGHETEVFMYSVYEQGSGLLQAEAMLTTLAHVYPSKLDLKSISPNERMEDGLVLETSMTIANTGSETMFYYLTHTPGTSFHLNTHTALYDRNLNKMEITFLDIHSRTQTKTLAVHANSNTEFLVQFRISKETLPFALLNGYLQLTPITIYKKEDGSAFFLALKHPSFKPLSVPYSCLYGDLHRLPTITKTGPKRSFLTNVNIFKWNEASATSAMLEVDQMPMYLETPTFIHSFTFKAKDKPVISMCLFFPVKTLKFLVFNHLTNMNLGEIQTYENFLQGCYVFFLDEYFYALPHGKVVPSHWDMSMAGWNGRYMPQGKMEPVQIEQGTIYCICAQIEKQTKIPRKEGHHQGESYDWCSPGFTS